MIPEIPSAQQLHQWHTDFMALNNARMESTRSLMTSRQRLVLDALPMLIHLNHQQLPGFINHDVPCGILHFQPEVQHQHALQSLARGVNVPRDFFSDKHILGLYLMGSLGSLAQSRSSDLDVWLCHDEHLDAEQLDLLKQKCDVIERWAASQSVELHFFPMNLSDFRQGQSQSAEGEDCGSSQHLLLLDEFYRSALWLAGAKPSWWLIPEKQERKSAQYWEQLLDQHRVQADQWLHFGQIHTIPVAEFVGAGLWQLNKGLSNPYKALLKLLLTRHYATQYPNIRPLCWDLKARVHQGITDVENCDAYLLMLERVIKQLEQEGNQQRVQLARRAFYYKAKLPLSDLSRNQRNSWRAKTLNHLCSQWGWLVADFIELDRRDHWNPVKVYKERNALISEMLSSYRFLAGFSQKHAPKLHIQPADMRLLGNRLYAAFDAKPGKIIDINPGISRSLQQEKLTLRLTPKRVWQLIPGNGQNQWQKDSLNQNAAETEQILKQSPSLMELLFFAQFNGLLSAHTNIALSPSHNPLSQYELKELLQLVREEAPLHPDNRSLMQPPQPRYWRLYVNAGVDPQHKFSRRGMQKLSNRDDALGYSSARENLVHTLDLLTVNSWGEWTVERFHGNDAMLLCLQHLLRFLPLARGSSTTTNTSNQWPPISTHCHCASRARSIQARVEHLLHKVMQHFIQQPRSPYLIEASEQYYLLRNETQGIQLQKAQNSIELLRLLQRPNTFYAPCVLDDVALLQSPLRLIYQRARPGIWQLFFWRRKNKFFFYLLDDKGALLHQQWHDDEGSRRLLPIIRFLRQLDQRWLSQLQGLNPSNQGQRKQQRNLLLFEIRSKKQSLELELVRRKLPPLHEQTSLIDLRAVVDEQQQTTLYCNNQEFSVWQFGDDLYQAVAEEVQAIRSQRENYPCYLSDVSLPHDNQQVITHLRQKQRIEKLLNQALLTLPSSLT
ncbi:class I adenylate cyclase [Bacterioplanoides sp.]|uniref:class I adenylate cyclase n=1 Tax=Bacterioplanoides sp. TaxID=2066072 RepID=UPI003B002E66